MKIRKLIYAFAALMILIEGCKISPSGPLSYPENAGDRGEPSQKLLWNLVENPTVNFQFRRNQPKPVNYQLYILDTAFMRSILNSIPKEGEITLSNQRDTISLPIAGRGLADFQLRNSPVMAPELSAQFPEIQTFTGSAALLQAWHLKCELTPKGFAAQIVAPDHTYFIEPVLGTDLPLYIVFKKSDLPYNPDKKFEE